MSIEAQEQQVGRQVRSFYTKLYYHEKEDSPDDSRTSIIKRLKRLFSRLAPEDLVLEVGAGRGIVGREYQRYYGLPPARLLTLDLADIEARLLLSRKFSYHLQADGSKLPFGNRTFSGAFSNMALDFFPSQALVEMGRVLKPGSELIVNLHHPSLIPADIEEKLKNFKLSKRAREVYTFWKYLKDKDLLFKSKEQIQEIFGHYGFAVNRVEEVTGKMDQWWEVDMQKN